MADASISRRYITGSGAFTRAVDPVTKRPVGPVTGEQHFHGRLTPHGMRPGFFRISVAQDRIAFALGERVHRLLQWK
jgi:hypothetical protein